ncbi:MAG: hypothetical protein IJU20_08895 [Clostridia bacterium]|nr:hypothetical protein [Clostridia bacterium]
MNTETWTEQFASQPQEACRMPFEDPVYLDPLNSPFSVYNLLPGSYARYPAEVTSPVSPTLTYLGGMCTGGRIRFRTDSPYLGLCVEFGPGESGADNAYHSFDLYEQKAGFLWTSGMMGTAGPFREARVGLVPGMKDLTLYLPLMRQIVSLRLVLKRGSRLGPGSPYKGDRPIVAYGSSIVHGVGTSRPGMTYPAILSRMLNRDVINLGVSGNARAEENVMRYLSGLPMSVFLFDYDHNTPSVEYLEQTHFRGYEIFRKAQPRTPIVFASKVDYYNGDEQGSEKRRQVILQSFWQAREEMGDRFVYYVDGPSMYPRDKRDLCTQDRTHPNCMGYYYMAKAFLPVIRQALADAGEKA